jgi:hypothetical protein
MQLLTKLVASKKLGKIVTVEEAIAYYVKSKELGLPFISSMDHMFNISGKTNVDVHLMRAMVLRAGVIHWEEVYNNIPLYKYIDDTNKVIATGINEECLPNIYEAPKGKDADELKADVNRIKGLGKTPVFKTMDKIIISDELSPIFNYATRYKFFRQRKFPDGKIYTITEYGEFSIKEAIYAGLHLDKSGNINVRSPWLIYHRNMLEHRAWTFGARKIADDILFGLLEQTEYLDMEKIPYDIQDGKVVVQPEDHNN